MTSTPTEPDQNPDETTAPTTPIGPGEDPVVLPEEEQPAIQPI